MLSAMGLISLLIALAAAGKTFQSRLGATPLQEWEAKAACAEQMRALVHVISSPGYKNGEE